MARIANRVKKTPRAIAVDIARKERERAQLRKAKKDAYAKRCSDQQYISDHTCPYCGRYIHESHADEHLSTCCNRAKKELKTLPRRTYDNQKQQAKQRKEAKPEDIPCNHEDWPEDQQEVA